MAVSDYLQKSSSTCSYSYSKLKDVLYLVSAAHVKDITIDKDNDEAHIEELDELPLRINGFNIQFKEESSLDERYKFQKTLTLSMHGYVNYKLFDEKYYAIIEDVEGTFWMVNVDFPSRITHTFNLSKDTNQTDFTFSSLSNFPTLKLDNDFEAVEPVCLGLNVYGIEKLQLIEKEKATLDTREKTVISTEPFKTIDFLGNSCSFQEVYDGTKVTDTITFNIAFNNYKPSWQYKLLEFLENRYSAIITPKSHDNEYYPGYNFGLQPSYTIQTASNPGESDIITVTLVETSFYGATADVDWKDEQSTETRWRWVKNVNGTICWECIGYNTARYLVKQQVDYFGNPTGNYQVMEGYESQYSSFNIVDTFTEEVTFANASCGGGNCNITTNIPSIIQFNSATCNTYTLQTSCDWSFINIPSNITITPSSGNANTNYTVSICNTATPSSTPIENTVTLKCCAVNRTINLKVIEDNNCIRPSNAYINCLGQEVSFVYDGSCRPTITSIDSRLTYEIGTNRLTVKVPRNYNTSAITWTITATNCGCSSSSTTFAIHQDKVYDNWVQEDGYTCESGNSYHIERRYTGTTQDNITVRTDETRKGSLITSGDTRCGSSQTKWEWDNESYYCVNGNKVKAIFEWISYDNGTNWLKTGNTRLGDMVEANSEWCNSAVTYSWVLTDKYECEGMPSGTKIYATYSDDKTYSLPCNDSTTLGRSETMPVGYEASAMTSAVIGDCVERIGWSPFYDCYSLSSVAIPNSVTYIGTSAFYNCSGLTSIDIPSGVTTIGDSVFTNCYSLSSVTIPNSVTSIGINVFENCSDLTSVNIGSGVTSIGYQCFYNCNSLTSVTIPDSVTSIGLGIFQNCSSLTSVNIGGGIANISNWAFANCYSLSSVTIPNSVTSIGRNAFGYCSGLTSVNIGSGVTSIDSSAFQYCSSLISVTIPSGVTSIGGYAFNRCTDLTSITCLATTPPTLGDNVFLYTNECPIYVPSGSVNAYKSAEVWSTYADRIQAIN